MTDPTVDALAAALPHDWADFYEGQFGDELNVEWMVESQAAELAKAGYALVRAKDTNPTLTAEELHEVKLGLLNRYHYLPDGSGNTSKPAAKSAYDKLAALVTNQAER